jgi:thioredoxin reductase
MHDLIVIGGGPAGLTATMYAVQKRLDVLLITRDLGGKTNYHPQLPFVERHMVINGDEVVNRFSREIEYLDFLRVMDNAESVEAISGGYQVTVSGGHAYKARTLIVATGTKGQLLEVPGEREFMMRGLGYSAASYAQLFIDREVAVVGDGALAMRSTAELAKTARQVTLIAPTRGELDSPLGRKLQAMDHITILEGYKAREIRGDLYARSVVATAEDEERDIVVDAIFVEMDLIPRSDLVAGLVDLDESKRIKVNARNETSAPGIFAAGDVTDGYAEQVLICIGEGAKAALSAYEYLLKLEG